MRTTFEAHYYLTITARTNETKRFPGWAAALLPPTSDCFLHTFAMASRCSSIALAVAIHGPALAMVLADATDQLAVWPIGVGVYPLRPHH